MLSNSNIDYLDAVYQPAVGCNGTCSYCWARNRWAPRQIRHCQLCAEYVPHIHPERWDDVTPRQKPKRIGVGFFADLFGPWKWARRRPGRSHLDTGALIEAIDEHIDNCPQHQFFTLTRWPENIPRDIDWPHNWWIGVTVTNQAEADRLIPALLASGVLHPWVSYEPARAVLDLSDYVYPQGRHLFSRGGIEWLVAGGMTGKHAVPSHPDWFRKVRDDCVAAGVPYYMKQMTRREPIPADLMIRQMPEGCDGD